MVRRIKLTNSEKQVLIDEEDYDRVKDYGWYLVKNGKYKTKLAIKASLKGKLATQNKKINIHRMIMNAPKNKVVDHVNGNVFDNRKENLRICSHAKNTLNSKVHRDKKIGIYKGVFWQKQHQKWMARCTFEGKVVYCGFYDSEYVAAIAYDLAAKSWHGEFARCNILSHGSF